MRFNHFSILIPVAFVILGCSQANGQAQGLCIDEKFDKEIANTISFTVPLMGVEELHARQEELVVFDTRKKEEYEMSHIPGAKYLGYKDFEADRLGDLPKDAKIVLYCSIGYRSEKIGQRLQAMGYKNVFNLYGSIFEWANRSYPLENKEGESTLKVHTYNKAWSKWVDGQKAEKVW